MLMHHRSATSLLMRLETTGCFSSLHGRIHIGMACTFDTCSHKAGSLMAGVNGGQCGRTEMCH